MSSCGGSSRNDSGVCGGDLLAFLGDDLVAFRGEELDVARTGQERSDSTVRSVGSSPASGGSVDLHVGDDDLLGVQVSDLRVGFEVREEVQDDSDGLLRPSALGHSELGGLGGSAGGASVSGVGNTPLVLEDLVEVLLRSLHSHALEDSGGVVRVLEVDTDVVSARFDGCLRSTTTFFRVRWLSGVLLRHSFILIIMTNLNTTQRFPRELPACPGRPDRRSAGTPRRQQIWPPVRGARPDRAKD